MPTVGVNARVFKAVTVDAKQLIPRGQSTVPMRVQLKNSSLIFTLRGVCTLRASIDVESDEVADITVNFLNISEYIPSEGEISISLTKGMGMQIESSEVSVVLVPAFSTVEDIDLTDHLWHKLENSSLITSLHTLSSTGLDGLYKKAPPIEIFKKIAVLKYANIYVQARAPELESEISITQECAKIVQSFAPKEYTQISSDTYVFRKYNTLLYVPVKLINGNTTIKDVIRTDGIRVQLDVSGFLNKLTTMRKLGVDVSDVVLCEKGISATATSDLSSITVHCGNKDSKYLSSFKLPMPLLYICFKLIGDALVEILYKEGVLCLRTPTLAIALHVLV